MVVVVVVEKEGGSGRLLREENAAEWPAEAAGGGEGGCRSAHSATIIWVHLDGTFSVFFFSFFLGDYFFFGG